MVEIHNEINNEINQVKRGRGRPKKGEVVIKLQKKPVGRPKKYEEGYVEHRYTKQYIERSRYKELLEIEQKYNELLNIIQNKNI